jgi:peptide/nickel transport system permease protein/microcin C transport system permease protein
MLTLSPSDRGASRGSRPPAWLVVAVAVFRLFGLSLGGELIANDKPLLVEYQGQWYFPAFKRYTEQDFGGELPFQPDYRSAHVRQLIEEQGGWMLFAPIPFSDDTSTTT